jgi:predicted Zn-dependent peptidase
LILQQLDDVRAGRVTAEELQATRLAFENRLLMMEDSPAALMEVDFSWRLCGVDYNHAAYGRRLARVTLEEMQEAASAVELDTVYVLESAQDPATK